MPSYKNDWPTLCVATAKRFCEKGEEGEEEEEEEEEEARVTKCSCQHSITL